MIAREKIFVVGAGPTGLTLACLLLRRGVACRIIDASPEATQRSRAIGVSGRSLEVLDELGIANRLVQLGLPSREAIFYSDGRAVGRLTAKATRDTRFPFLLAIPQSSTEAVLNARLIELGGRVERGVALTELQDDPTQPVVALTLEGSAGTTTAEAAWVIGADGAHSIVRKYAGIDFLGDATGNIFANVDTRLKNAPTAGVGHYYFSRHGMLVIAPLPGDIYRVTATINAAEAEGPLTLQDVQHFVSTRAAPGVEVLELRDAGWGVARIPIQTRIATQFRAGRCLLAGDAAHIYGPTGAQGMNGGIQDAHALAWRLALVTTARGQESLLDAYARERRAVAVDTLHHVEQQTRMAVSRSRLAAGARDAFLGIATRTGLLDRALAPRISQFDLRYRDRSVRMGHRATGRRVPNVPLTGPRGEPTDLFSVLAECGLTVLVTGARPTDAAEIDRLTEQVARGYPDLVGLRTIWRQPAPSNGLVDHTGRLHRFFGSTPSAWLIRPDHHVAQRAALGTPAPLLRLLGELLLVPGAVTGPVA